MDAFLITGGAGFIGSHLADALLAAGARVRVLDDLSTGRRDNLDPRCELRVGDVADSAALRGAITGMAGCSHLAAIASVARGNADWRGTHRTNQGGTIAVLDGSLAAEREAAAAFQRMAKAENTRTAYRAAVRAWCDRRGALPCPPPAPTWPPSSSRSVAEAWHRIRSTYAGRRSATSIAPPAARSRSTMLASPRLSPVSAATPPGAASCRPRRSRLRPGSSARSCCPSRTIFVACGIAR